MAASADSSRKAFSAVAATVDTPEQLGVTLIQAVLTSALKSKNTSQDGKMLVVPIDIAITPLADAHARGADVENCHSECWKVLGHDVFCRKICVMSSQTDERHAELSDAALLTRVKSGPALEDAGNVDAALRSSAVRAASASEAGIMLSNSIAVMLADGTIPIGDDGAAKIEATALIAAKKTGSKHCTHTTIQILGYDVVTYETCDTETVTLS